MVFIRDTLGPLLNVPITDVRATARCRTDFRGLLGLDGAPPDLKDLELGIEVVSPDEQGVRSVYQAWLERCPVSPGPGQAGNGCHDDRDHAG